MDQRARDVERIREALQEAGTILRRFSRHTVGVGYKGHDSPVTEADLAADAALRQGLPRVGEGWLSEETPDDPARLACRRVWVVDPLDGTREFLEGVPQWSVSIGLVEDGAAVAGGVYNPTTDELFLGAPGLGATLNGRPVVASARTHLEGAVVLASRWAMRRRRERGAAVPPYTLRPVGPLAYSLALIASGRADALWGRSAKAEWDVAAGAALIAAAGGHVTQWDGTPIRLNRWPPRIAGLVAGAAGLRAPLRKLIAAQSRR
jgi:myo-inositol-1(or 4)-monophosphatase